MRNYQAETKSSMGITEPRPSKKHDSTVLQIPFNEIFDSSFKAHYVGSYQSLLDIMEKL
jgi:hypothetical protein